MVFISKSGRDLRDNLIWLPLDDVDFHVLVGALGEKFEVEDILKQVSHLRLCVFRKLCHVLLRVDRDYCFLSGGGRRALACDHLSRAFDTFLLLLLLRHCVQTVILCLMFARLGHFLVCERWLARWNGN